MRGQLVYFINRLREKLWFRPFVFCLFSIVAALTAQFADDTLLKDLVPRISKESLNDLLSTLSASMLVIAIFAVASMVSAFSAASSTATPRSFKLVVTDDVSQNALSIFIGTFIYSIVATVALKNGFYEKAGIFILFGLTILFFAVVIITFLRWVDRISRLGRLSNTVQQVEKATHKSILKYLQNPFLGASPQDSLFSYKGEPCYAHKIGYLHTINLENLQELAEKEKIKIDISCLPGGFVSFNTPLAYSSATSPETKEQLVKAFVIDDERSFDDDPRFGLITLSEIASRALSPGINDPGTAIQIIGSMARLFSLWQEETLNEPQVQYNRISAPKITVSDFFTDAFRPIARDGAGSIEVMTRLQKCFRILETINNPQIKKESQYQALQAFKRAEIAMDFQDDIEELRKVTFTRTNS